MVATLPSGRVHVSVMPIRSQAQELGFAILLHDLSFIERREAKARTFLIITFGILAIMAFGVPMFGGQMGAQGLEPGSSAPAARWRERESGIPTHSQRPAGTGWAHGQRSGRRTWIVDRGTPEADPEPAFAWREDCHPGKSRTLHPPAYGRRRDRSPTSRERPGDRARTGSARLLRCVGRARQRRCRPRNRGPQLPRPRATGRRILPHPPRVALGGGAAGLLLRVFERRVMAAVSRSAHAARVPR